MASLLEVRRGDIVVRRTGDAPTGDILVDRAFDNLVRIDQFLRNELGRDGWDGKGGALRADLEGLNGRNATFVTATGTIVLGGRPLVPLGVGSFGFSATIMGHEVGHGIQIALGKYSYANYEMIAIAESFGDVMGTGADDSNWILGDELLGGEPAPGQDYRDLANPPYRTLHDIPASGARPEGYSQLLSYAAVLVAHRIGNSAMRKLWYAAMQRMPDDLSTHGFTSWVASAQRAAIDLHGPHSPATAAVTHAFTAIGLLHTPEKRPGTFLTHASPQESTRNLLGDAQPAQMRRRTVGRSGTV